MEVPESRDRGELVERRDFFSFVLIAAGYSPKDFEVKVVREELRVEAPDFEVTRPLGCRVDASRVRAEYRNGVLSVRVPKQF